MFQPLPLYQRAKTKLGSANNRTKIRVSEWFYQLKKNSGRAGPLGAFSFGAAHMHKTRHVSVSTACMVVQSASKHL